MGILGLNSSRGQLANSNQQFAIKEIKGQTFSYQPSIQRRLSGVKTIKILVPQRTMTDIEKFIYGNLKQYFRILGIRTIDQKANYEQDKISAGPLVGYNVRINDSAAEQMQMSYAWALVIYTLLENTPKALNCKY